MPFHPSLMFVGKAKSLPNSKAPESFFTQVGSGLNRLHIGLSQKDMPGKNALAYYEHS
jgi:hypothetical protein